MTSAPSIREIVEFGLDAIPTDRMVQVPLRDLVHVHQVLGELNRFFHQRMHYPSLAAVEQFMGSRGNGGGYEMLSEAYYKKLGPMMPADIDAMFDEGALEHPVPPAYYSQSV